MTSSQGASIENSEQTQPRFVCCSSVDDLKQKRYLLVYEPESIHVDLRVIKLEKPINSTLRKTDGQMVTLQIHFYRAYPKTEKKLLQEADFSIENPDKFFNELRRKVFELFNSPIPKSLSSNEPAKEIKLKDIFSYVGNKIKTTGRVVNTFLGVTADGAKKQVLFHLDAIEKEEAREEADLNVAAISLRTLNSTVLSLDFLSPKR